MTVALLPPAPDFLDELKTLLGPGGWRTGPDVRRYLDDPRGRFHGQGNIALLPASTDQVAEIVRRCAERRVGIVPWSGGTGVVAGQLSIDRDDVIILSLERMNRVREVLVDDGVIVVEAGCILEHVHMTAQENGMTFPLSMASKGSCCIGGNLATNAGGIQVVRYGNARDLCVGIEAVLPNGEVLRELSPLRKNNTGYDLRHLLIGSEGTLGIITAAALVLKPAEAETVTAMCAVASPTAALGLFRQLRGDLGESISALELMSGFGLSLVTAHFPTLRSPFAERPDWCVLLEVAGQAGVTERLETALGTCFEKGLVRDAVIASSQAQSQNLWDLRENTPEANRSEGAICNSDTSVPISKVGSFISATFEALARIDPGLRVNTYGHVGDGNIHHNVFPPAGIAKADFVRANPEIIEAVRMAINETTHRHGGSISAEHGIGRLKKHDLQLYTGAAKLDAMRRIKRALDPLGIMNPGALFD